MPNGKRLLVSVSSSHRMRTPALAQERKGASAVASLTIPVGCCRVRKSSTTKNVASHRMVRVKFFINDLDGWELHSRSHVRRDLSLQTPVTVVAGQTANAEVKLEVESQNLQVSRHCRTCLRGSRGGQSRAQRDNILQVFTRDVLRSLPNANMADHSALAKRNHRARRRRRQVRADPGTEPRLAQRHHRRVNTLSQNRRASNQADAIRADIVESVEIKQTLQANMGCRWLSWFREFCDQDCG